MEGRSLSKGRGEGFAAENWLRNDGDGAGQVTAYARGGFEGTGRLRQLWLGENLVVHGTGKAAAQQAIAGCAEAAIVVVNVMARAPDGCTVYDEDRLRDTGALGIFLRGQTLAVESARARQGARLWSQ